MREDQNQKTEKQNLMFQCPVCGSNELWEYLVNYQNIGVFEDGTWEEGDSWWESDKVEFFCLNCDYLVADDHGNPIRNHHSLERWLKGESVESIDFARDENGNALWEPETDTANVDLEPGMLRFCCPACGGEQLDAVTKTATYLYFDEEGNMHTARSTVTLTWTTVGVTHAGGS